LLVLARRADTIGVRPSGSLGPWLPEVSCSTASKVRVARLRREERELRASARADADVTASSHSFEDLDDSRVLHEA
jgi:hypothetical protein